MKLSSFKYAIDGIIIGVKTEKNFKLMFLCFILVIAANTIFCVNHIEWAVTILCCGAVLSTELINSAIERTIDLITDEQNHTAGVVKDLSAGAALIVSIASATVAAIIYLPYLFGFIKELK